MRKLLALVLLSVALLGLTFSFSTAQEDSAPRNYWVPLPAWSPDGSKVAIPINNFVELRDANTRQMLFTLAGHTDFIPQITWSPDNRMIATASYDQTIKLWGAANGILTHTLAGHEEPVTALAWSRDSTRLVSSGYDSQIGLFVWDPQSGNLLSTNQGGSIVDIAFSPDGRYLAYITPGFLRVLEGENFESIASFRPPLCCSNSMYSLAWSPDSSKLVTGSVDGSVTIWNASTAQISMQFSANEHTISNPLNIENPALSWVRDVTFNPDGSTVRAVSGDGTVQEWDANTGDVVQTTQIAPLIAAAWSPDGNQLAIRPWYFQEVDTLNQWESFELSKSMGEIDIIVPFATP